MKYVVILGDGMADERLEQLQHRSPLEAANKPVMDRLASEGELGLVRTVPAHIAPGSDVANLSVMGYNPDVFYTGRSPLEAVSMGLTLADTDVALRCNLVTLSEDAAFEDKIMIDYSSDEISTEEAGQLILAVQQALGNDIFTFYPGISYRHCLIWKHGPTGLSLTPPHDILERKITEYLPAGVLNQPLLDFMKMSEAILKDHPVNRSRRERGLNPATHVWLWGEGKRPALASFSEKYGIRGAVISAVDLIKGIGICAGLRSIDVEGATGNIHTNFRGKADACIEALKNGADFVYVHIEAPDECGHRFEISNKVLSIERIDQDILAPVLAYLESQPEPARVLIAPDHPTPLRLRTHTREPVPYVLWDKSHISETVSRRYDEFSAADTGTFVDKGYTLMDKLIRGSSL